MKKILVLDYILLAVMVSVITLQPYYIHGAINFYETGFYLPQINELFHGKVLYRDMFVLRGPLEILMPAALMALFGKHIGVLSAYFYFGTVLTLIICSLLGLRMYKTRVFTYLMALVLIGKTFVRVNFNNWGGIRFGIGLLAILFAIEYFKKEKKWYLFIAGIFSAIGFFTSFEVGICSILAILVSLFFSLIFKSRYKYIGSIAIYILGLLVILLPFFLYFLITGALMPFFETVSKVYTDMVPTFSHPLRLGTPKNFYEFLLALNPFNHNIRYMWPFFIYLTMGIYLARRFLKRRLEMQDAGILSLGIYGVGLYQSVFRNIEGPQFEMALQPVIIILFLLLERMYIWLKQTKRKLCYIFIAIIALGSLIYSIQRYNHRFFIFKYKKEFFVDKKGVKILFPDTKFAALSIERAKGIVVPEPQRNEIENVVKYIQSRTTKNEKLFTFPALGAYNFLTDRPFVGRFGVVELSWISEDWHRELINDLDNSKPPYILIEKDISRLNPYMDVVGADISETKSYINKYYQKDVIFGNIEIWRRRI